MSEAERLVEECQKIFVEIKCLSHVLVDMVKNHEKNLSDIVDRIDQNLQHKEFTFEDGRQVAVVDCRNWTEFRKVSVGASLVAYETDLWNVFSVTSACHNFIFRYSERLPVSKNDVMPEDSICNKVLNLNRRSLRRWLSDEIRVPEEKIIEGNLVALSQYKHEDDAKRDTAILEYYKNI